MRLENLFFKFFFYPFLLGVFLSTIIVTIFLGISTDNNHDKQTRENIINIGKKKSKLKIKSVSSLLTTFFLKFQAGLNEEIRCYQKVANKLMKDENSYEYQNKYLKSAVSLDFETCWDYDNVFYMSDWLIDEVTSDENLNDTRVKLQLKAYSNIIENINSVSEANYPDGFNYIFYFEDTELYLFFPLLYDCGYLSPSIIANYHTYEETHNPCLKENGEYHTAYQLKCEAFFKHMQRAKTNAFDNNYSAKRNKTIFVNNFYKYIEQFSLTDLTMCIEFEDPITKGNGYACIDGYYLYLRDSLNVLNENLMGYFFISNVGFSNVFYFPESTSSPKIPTDYIFDREINHKLYEKKEFNDIRKIFSSNYIDYIGNATDEEVYVNGHNSSGQYFYVEGIKLKYSIFPVTFENLNGEIEHVFSIIYVYNEDLFIKEIDKYYSSITIKIILELLFFIIFGSGLLYIIF